MQGVDPRFIWNNPNISNCIAAFKTIRRFSIYTDAYLVQPADSTRAVCKFLANLVDHLPANHPLEIIFVLAAALDDDERAALEGWESNMAGDQFTGGFCYSCTKVKAAGSDSNSNLDEDTYGCAFGDLETGLAVADREHLESSEDADEDADEHTHLDEGGRRVHRHRNGRTRGRGPRLRRRGSNCPDICWVENR